MVRHHFRDRGKSVVVDLRPESHQLSMFKSKLRAVLSTGAYDHTIAAFWYFVILSEILIALKRQLEYQPRHRLNNYSQVQEIDSALEHLKISESGDFTARINRLGSYIIQEIKARAAKKEKFSPEKLTNIVFQSGIAEAKQLVVKHSLNFDDILFLFDNIDKGWAADGVDELDVKLARLLLEALEKVKRDLSAANREFVFVVFLRNDVFELMVSNTPDKGKAAVVRIDWTDRAKLRQVIYRRLQASADSGTESFQVLWNKFFVEKVNGRDAFEYIVDHCLMRPRFLIAIVEMAIANAINRGHSQVLEEDCIDAVRQHSHSILSDFGYEIQDVSRASEMVLHSLVGSTEYITKAEVLERFEKAKIIAPEGREKLFDYLLWYGVLGVVNNKNAECYIYDFEYNMKRLRAEIFALPDEPLYAFNPALRVALKAKGP